MNTLRTSLLAAAACVLISGPVAAATEETQPPPTGPAPAAKPLAPDGTRGMALMSAAVRVSGTTATLVRGSGVTSITRIGAGLYQVIFDRDVTQCFYVATIGDPFQGNSPQGFIDVAARGGNANGVFIETHDPSNALADRSFQLLVFCNK